MPELPEMEIVARRLAAALPGERIESVMTPGLNALKTFDPPLSALDGATFRDVRRRGKLLLLEAETEDTVYSDCIAGYTMRTTRSPWHDEWASEQAPPILKPPLQMLLSSNYIQGSLGGHHH